MYIQIMIGNDNGAASEAACLYDLNTISRSKCFYHSATDVIGFGGCIFKN